MQCVIQLSDRIAQSSIPQTAHKKTKQKRKTPVWFTRHSSPISIGTQRKQITLTHIRSWSSIKNVKLQHFDQLRYRSVACPPACTEEPTWKASIKRKLCSNVFNGNNRNLKTASGVGEGRMWWIQIKIRTFGGQNSIYIFRNTMRWIYFPAYARSYA